MATTQASTGYSPPIGGFWGNLPVLSTINQIDDLTNNPDANVAHDVAGIAGTAVPGPIGFGLSALSSALPGGWLDSILGLGDFSSTLTPPTAVGTTGDTAGMFYQPGLTGNAPGTGFWGAVQSGLNSIGNALGLTGQDTSSGDNSGIGSKFGG